MASIVDIATDVVPTFLNGVVTVGTNEVQLFPNGISNVMKGVQLKAAAGNADVIYVGRAGVTSVTGFPLAAGEGLFLPINDADKIYAISGAVSQAFNWLAL